MKTQTNKTMVKQQTAVRWLIEELGEYFPHEIGGIHLMVEKAEQMEKDIIVTTYDISLPFISGEEYYNHIFKKENQ